jgi:hypothetical protein
MSIDDMRHLSMYFLFSLVRMMSGKGNIWQPVILNSSNILNYFNRRYVSPLYVCSLLSGADDFRKGKHLAACVILNSSHILNYFNRRYVSPLYVCSLLSGADDFRKGKHLAACDPQQL